jgi:hypothetical protein
MVADFKPAACASVSTSATPAAGTITIACSTGSGSARSEAKQRSP